MSYIIVWRHSHREPHVDVDSHYFLETYSSYEDAKKQAEEIIKQEGSESPWYYDYAIYEEASN